jgi:hypothetical protein
MLANCVIYAAVNMYLPQTGIIKLGLRDPPNGLAQVQTRVACCAMVTDCTVTVYVVPAPIQANVYPGVEAGVTAHVSSTTNVVLFQSTPLASAGDAVQVIANPPSIGASDAEPCSVYVECPKNDKSMLMLVTVTYAICMK